MHRAVDVVGSRGGIGRDARQQQSQESKFSWADASTSQPLWERRDWKCTGRNSCGKITAQGTSECVHCGLPWSFELRKLQKQQKKQQPPASKSQAAANKAAAGSTRLQPGPQHPMRPSGQQQAAAPGQGGQPPARDPADDEAHQHVAKLTKAHEATAAQLGPEHPCSVQLAVELREAKQKLQANRPLGIRLQSAQSRLQLLDQSLVKAHEEFEEVTEKIDGLIKYKEEVTAKGKALVQQKTLAEKEVQHLAACLACESAEWNAHSYNKQVEHITRMVPAGHPLASQIANLAATLLQLVEQVSVQAGGLPMRIPVVVQPPAGVNTAWPPQPPSPAAAPTAEPTGVWNGSLALQCVQAAAAGGLGTVAPTPAAVAAAAPSSEHTEAPPSRRPKRGPEASESAYRAPGTPHPTLFGGSPSPTAPARMEEDDVEEIRTGAPGTPYHASFLEAQQGRQAQSAEEMAYWQLHGLASTVLDTGPSFATPMAGTAAGGEATVPASIEEAARQAQVYRIQQAASAFSAGSAPQGAASG